MLHENHGAEVAFRLVYIAEAHASDEWPIGAHIQQPQPRSTAERCGVARRRLAELGVARLPVLVDTAPDNAFGKAYASWPLRWFFLDGHTLTAVAQPNLLDRVWARPGAPARAPPPSAEARELPIAVAGQPAAEKLDGAREAARAAGADGLVVCMLDEVCWLLNVRGSDVPCCPVVEGYVVVAATDGGEAALGGDRAVFFADEGKVRRGAQFGAQFGAQ